VATLEEIGAALKRAAAAGDTAAATKLAAAYKAMQAGQGADTSKPPPGAVPGSREYADWAAQQARAGRPLPQVSQTPPPLGGPQNSPLDQINAGYTSAVNAVPIAGPSMLNGIEGLKARMYGVPQPQIASEDAVRQQANPTASTIGSVAGTVLPFMAGAEIPYVAGALGMSPTAGLLTNTVASGLSSAAIGGADTLMRGGDLGQAAKDAGISGGIGLVIPGMGAALRGVGKALPKAVDWSLGGIPSFARNAANVTKSAQKAVGKAMTADMKAGLGMTAAEDAGALAAGQNVINMDRGGPATRRLARVASAASPEAKAALEGATDRGVPGLDTGQFLTKLVGGSADDLALREGLQNQARLVNAPAYRKAYASPAAQSIWTADISNMFQAPEFATAVKQAEEVGRTRAAVDGSRAVRQPFVFNADGSVSMKPGVTPTLEFWDKVKIGLDRQIQALSPTEKSRIADLTALKKKLVDTLDSTVPEYKTARQGAAAFFGADNALDAGRQFALQPRNLPEALQALSKMSPVDRKAFSIGAASSAIDKLKTGSTYAVVKGTFGSPAQKEFWRATLGQQKAAQLEAYVKVQGLMEESKRAIQGGSHTYDLMVAGGLGAAGATGSYLAPGNNFSTAAYFLAALRAGRGVLGRKVDQQIAENVANLLASGDKAALNKVIANASMSPKWQAALDALVEGTNALARAGAVAAPQAIGAQ
jgi:hypothetical protein